MATGTEHSGKSEHLGNFRDNFPRQINWLLDIDYVELKAAV